MCSHLLSFFNLYHLDLLVCMLFCAYIIRFFPYLFPTPPYLSNYYKVRYMPPCSVITLRISYQVLKHQLSEYALLFALRTKYVHLYMQRHIEKLEFK